MDNPKVAWRITWGIGLAFVAMLVAWIDDRATWRETLQSHQFWLQGADAALRQADILNVEHIRMEAEWRGDVKTMDEHRVALETRVLDTMYSASLGATRASLAVGGQPQTALQRPSGAPSRP